MADAPIVVIGVGSPDQGDDGVGPAVATALRAVRPPGVRALVGAGDPAKLIEAWQGARLAVLVDAMSSGRAAGTVERFDATERPLPAKARLLSSHGAGPAEAVELARALGRLPRRMVVYGVEAGSVIPGEGLSEPVLEASHLVLGMLLEEVAGA